MELSSVFRRLSVSALSSARWAACAQEGALDRNGRLVRECLEIVELFRLKTVVRVLRKDADNADRHPTEATSGRYSAFAPGSVSVPKPAA